MPDKRRLLTSKVCFDSEKAGLLENSYIKCALVKPSRLIKIAMQCNKMLLLNCKIILESLRTQSQPYDFGRLDLKSSKFREIPLIQCLKAVKLTIPSP